MKKKHQLALGLVLITILVLLLIYIQSNKNQSKSVDYEPKRKGGIVITEDLFLVSDSLVKHTYFSLSYNEKYEQSNFVVYLLTSNRMLQKSAYSRKNDFRIDPLVKTGSSELKDYRKSGFDRGHLCPAGDMGFSEIAMSESFFMSNMSPQHPSFNRGAWKVLEEWVRQKVVDNDSIIVYTGPVLNDDITQFIGPNKVGVPKHYFKALFSISEQKGIAFILENKKSSNGMRSTAIKIDSLEKIIKINLFSSLPDEIENKIESQNDFDDW